MWSLVDRGLCRPCTSRRRRRAAFLAKLCTVAGFSMMFALVFSREDHGFWNLLSAERVRHLKMQSGHRAPTWRRQLAQSGYQSHRFWQCLAGAENLHRFCLGRRPAAWRIGRVLRALTRRTGLESKRQVRPFKAVEAGCGRIVVNYLYCDSRAKAS